MALDPLVSVEELAGWLRAPLAGDDALWAGLVLDAVSSLVRSQAGNTWEGVDVPGPARAVTFAVAARVYRNPEAASSYNVTTGPFGKSVSFADPAAVGLFLTSQEKAALGSSRSKSGLWTQATTRRDECSETIYVPVEGGAPDYPWYAGDVEI